jgi:DNA-binding beta-propeller fold protein YncE
VIRAVACALVLAACDDASFDRPTAVAFDDAGTVFVTDGYNHSRVARFSASGAFERDWGTHGSGDGELRTPHGVCVDREGRVYVADRENARVQIFDRDGALVAIWPSALVGRPWAVACPADGFVYVVDGGDQDPDRPRGGIAKLTPDGRAIARFDGTGILDGAHAIAVGRDGALFVAESDGQRIRKLVPTR